ncbi:MAG: hypothetical protein LC803_02950 [Acidobacteria bacterium]|nr:hypothetical protein [Acidobacteriota bacterium]
MKSRTERNVNNARMVYAPSCAVASPRSAALNFQTWGAAGARQAVGL